MNTINTHGIDVSVTINGRPVKVYSHEGRFFIESRDGTEYAIEIKNTNWYRVEAVVAVDGLSVITGKAASKDDSGYIISGNDKLVIKGFRKDLNEVGAFKFTKKEKSYAAGKGQADNVGVIAVAIYKEKYNPPVWGNTVTSTLWKTATSAKPDWYYEGPTSTYGGTSHTFSNTEGVKGSVGPSGTEGVIGSNILRSADVKARRINLDAEFMACASAQSVNFDHGTTWGQKITDKVITTTFDRDSLVLTTELFYNSKENLEAMGIKLLQEKQVSFPKGFPVDFAEPPPGWNG